MTTTHRARVLMDLDRREEALPYFVLAGFALPLRMGPNQTIRYHGIVILFGSRMPRKTSLGERLIRVPIAFPEELYEWLRLEAFQKRLPMAELVRTALLSYRERAQAGANAKSKS